jgi:hypothetical protein
LAEQPADQTRRVLSALGIWVGAHVLLLALLAVPGYVECQSGPPSSNNLFGGCGVGLGLTGLAIGWIQPIYGIVAIIIAFRRHHTAVAQGLVIGVCAVTLLFTALCFGSLFFNG